jgi:hypothetical protein
VTFEMAVQLRFLPVALPQVDDDHVRIGPSGE